MAEKGSAATGLCTCGHPADEHAPLEVQVYGEQFPRVTGRLECEADDCKCLAWTPEPR